MVRIDGRAWNELRPVTLDAQGVLQFEQFNGFLFFIANPLFLLAMLRGAAVSLPGRAELCRNDLPLPAAGRCIAAVCAVLTVLTCMHRTLGGWQFGARYTVDMLPMALMYLLLKKEEPGGISAFIMAAGMMFNLYGALAMTMLH